MAGPGGQPGRAGQRCVASGRPSSSTECVPGHGARPAWRLWLLVNQMRDCSPLCAQGPRNPQPWLEAGEWQPGAQGRCCAEAGGWGQAGSRGCIKVYFSTKGQETHVPLGKPGRGRAAEALLRGHGVCASTLTVPDPHGTKKGGAGSIFRMGSVREAQWSCSRCVCGGMWTGSS